MRELRIHGRGGQGAVVASKLLAVALFHEDKWVQSFPAFGVERRGAPVTAFLRVDRVPIRLRCEIMAPDDLIILDPTLVDATDVAAGLKSGGMILINTGRPPEAYPGLQERFRVVTVDAGAVATRHGLGSRTQPIVNTAILGAFAAASGLVSLESVCWAIREEVPYHPEANEAAAREAAGVLAAGVLAAGMLAAGMQAAAPAAGAVGGGLAAAGAAAATTGTADGGVAAGATSGRSQDGGAGSSPATAGHGQTEEVAHV